MRRQIQHVELARTLARRFNTDYGEVFVVPEAVLPEAGARVRDLSDPSRKMSKSGSEAHGIVFVLDEPEVIRRKFARAVTDGRNEVRYDAVEQPGVANLLDILAACRGTTPEDAAQGIGGYRDLKEAVGTAVIDTLGPVRERALALLEDRSELTRIRREGAERARKRSEHRLAEAIALAGLA
ncbi:tryptophan--tRNA ligase [Kitasatospora sp. NPDC056651]|uniref:tryptophan--tRNA ligase n=1 Tax=Kitasatospora sp. NPDC056651 TaxID=3345892 RepID=UPI00367C181F